MARKPNKLSRNTAEAATVDRAEADLRQGKSASTAAGEFVHEEIEHIRQGKHGARSAKQAIAIGLSKARRAGVPLGVPAAGRASKATRKSAQRELDEGPKRTRPAPKRSRAITEALKQEPRSSVSKRALSSQAKRAAGRRRTRGPRAPKAPRRTRRG
jgi:hypothetical protein